MAEFTKIEWCDATFNPWIGCTKVSPGCDHCYAECSTPARTLQVNWGPGAPRRRTNAANWALPKRWNAQADAFMAQHGRRQRVFCASLADVFDNAVDPQWRADLFELIAATPNLDWLLLTKRIGNVGNMLPVPFDFDRHFPNVWIGATIVNQAEADRDIPKLLAVPARVRFLSMEPLLGLVNLHPWLCAHGDMAKPEQHMGAWCTPRTDSLNWVIVGGESGPGARPMHPDWARSLRDQCEAAGVPFLFKQWGEWMPTIREGDTVKLVFEKGAPHGPDQPAFHDWPDGQGAARVGKKAAGRLLDGRTWDSFPNP
ncbi:phage Gp37/Gp68 family protein [Acidovorax sp.]|uniref:phage Gp37/Gp68 family protein n=1 Tax=Acidovorax sp. TaxID=1872122 RepID=UPI0031CF3132